MAVQLPFEQAHPLEVAPLLRQLQHDGVVHAVRTVVGDRAWLVTGYEEVRRLLADDRLGRSHPDRAGAARAGESVLFGGPMGNYDTEQADMARLRSLLQPHFSPRRMRALRPRVEELTAVLLDDLAEHGPPADLHQALALPLPVQVICELLGVPYADRDQLRAWSEAVGDVRDRATWCCWTTAPPTTIPPSSPALRRSTSPARGRPISRSGTVRTTASVPRWPASNCKPSSPSCRRASRRCGSASRPGNCGCATMR
jgi:cytochrome P450